MENDTSELKGPDRQIIVNRLQGLLKEIEALEKGRHQLHGTGRFKVWHREVCRWLEAGIPFTAREHSAFISVRFRPVTDIDSRAPDKIWEQALEEAHGLLKAAIENVTQGWVTPRASSPAPSAQSNAPALTVINSNTNIQLNALTVGTVLDRIAQEIEKRDETIRS